MDNISNRCTACPVFRLSSHREQAISMVQHLQTRIVPNHNVSQVVSTAIAKHKEQVDGQIRIVEKEFKSINDDIENQIFDACRELIKTLDAIDNSLSCILDDRNSDDFMKSDFLQNCFCKMNEMINERNQNINDFMDKLHQLEKKRTSMIEGCYKQHMLVIKRLSSDSFERLYEKYLKNYNTIKFSNFRTYEDIRFKLVQLNGSLQRDFVLKTYEVKMKIKNNIRDSFQHKLRTAVETTMWDKIKSSQTKSIQFLNSLNSLFNKIIRKLDGKFNTAFVIECSDLLKSHLKNLEKIIDSTSPLYDEVINDLQTILTNTFGEFNKTVTDSGELLSPDESITMFDEMTIEANRAQQEKTKTVIDIQLFLRDIKEAIRVIHTVFSPTIEILHLHSERLTRARNAVLIALDEKFKRNDSKLNILENDFNATFNTLIQASNETDLWEFEKNCEEILQSINDRIQLNQYNEHEVLADYKDLIASELDVTRMEVQVVLNLYPDSLKPLPEFNSATQNEHWTESIKKSLLSFKTTMKNCQNSIYKHMLTFVSELKSKDLLDNEYAWTTFLSQTIDGRFDVSIQILDFRTLILRDGTVNRRLDEIEEHQNLLDRHIKIVQEISASLRNKTNEMYERFNEQKEKIIFENGSIVREQSEINELSTTELMNLINEYKNQIHFVSSEFNNELKSHNKNIDAGYEEIIKSTQKYLELIKMFPEGGNYGCKEAVDIVNILNHLSNKMLDEKVETLKLLRPTGYKSLLEIKELLSKPMKSLEIELDKQLYRQKYYAINKLVNVTVNQEITNLDKMMNFLNEKLNVTNKTFKNGDVKESSKCWSEMLSETRGFIDFLLESYVDIRALLKPEIKNSIWNTKFEKAFVSSKISANSKHVFFKEKFKFYDYCKTIVTNSETIGGSRFLNNIYQSIYHYVSESQINAANMASIECMNTWIGTEGQDVTQIYYELMDEVVKKSKSIVLQAELLWIFKLSDFFDFLTALYKTESLFKNFVLATYHEESVTKLDEAFSTSKNETASWRKWSKDVREQLHCKLKPSHGHPQNAEALNALLDEFHRIRQECSESLADTCNRIGSNLGKIAENYETQFPKNVLKATTLFVKCHSSLQMQLDHIKAKSSMIGLKLEDQEVDAISETLVARISSSTNSVEEAVDKVKRHLRSTSSTIFWPNNKRLWADNVQNFMKLYRDRMNDVQMFNAVEKSKLVDWALVVVRDVEQVKKLHQ